MSTFLWFDENGIVVVIVEHYKYTEKKKTVACHVYSFISVKLLKENRNYLCGERIDLMNSEKHQQLVH